MALLRSINTRPLGRHQGPHQLGAAPTGIVRFRAGGAAPAKLDIDNLKYQACRKLFAKRSYCECCDKPDYQLNIDRNCYNEYSHDYLFKCNMSHVIDVIRFVYPNYPMEAVKIDFDILFPEEKVEKASMVNFTIDMSKLQL